MPDAQFILVTGGSGFIGSRLAAVLLESGLRVRIYDTVQPQSSRAEWVIGDIRDTEKLRQAAKGASLIYHLAAAHRDDIRPATLYAEVNVNGTSIVIAAAEAANVERIVFTSTVAVYGLDASPATETTPVRPFNQYGRTKAAAEQLLRAWASREPSRSLCIVRPSVVFGEGNRGNVYTLMAQIHSGRFLMVGNGRNKKSISYVGNVAQFLAGLRSSEPGVHIMNYADKPDLETRELVPIIAEALGKNLPAWQVPYPLAMAGGAAFDLLAALTGRRFPFSRIRVRKFCATTLVSSDIPSPLPSRKAISLDEGLRRTIAYEFPPRS